MRGKLNRDYLKKDIEKRKAKPGPELNQESKSPDSWRKVATQIFSSIRATLYTFYIIIQVFSGPQPETACSRLTFLTGLQIKESHYWILAVEESQRNQSNLYLEEEVPSLEFPAVVSHLLASPPPHTQSFSHSLLIVPTSPSQSNLPSHVHQLCSASSSSMWLRKKPCEEKKLLSGIGLESSLLHTPSLHKEPVQHSLSGGSKAHHSSF